MKPSELKQLIKEEIRSTLTEEKKYLNDMSYEELLAHRKRMDFKKASREEKKYVKDLIDKKKPLSEDSEDISSIKMNESGVFYSSENKNAKNIAEKLNIAATLNNKIDGQKVTKESSLQILEQLKTTDAKQDDINFEDMK